MHFKYCSLIFLKFNSTNKSKKKKIDSQIKFIQISSLRYIHTFYMAGNREKRTPPKSKMSQNTRTTYRTKKNINTRKNMSREVLGMPEIVRHLITRDDSVFPGKSINR